MNEPELIQDPSELRPENCERCREGLRTQSFVVHVDAEPPLSAPLEFWLCERCMQSMTRWMTRRQNGGRAFDPSEILDDSPAETPRGRGRKSRRKRSHYADVLDRNEAWIHRQNKIIVILTFLSFVAGLAVLYLMMSDTFPSLRKR